MNSSTSIAYKWLILLHYVGLAVLFVYFVVFALTNISSNGVYLLVVDYYVFKDPQQWFMFGLVVVAMAPLFLAVISTETRRSRLKRQWDERL